MKKKQLSAFALAFALIIGVLTVGNKPFKSSAAVATYEAEDATLEKGGSQEAEIVNLASASGGKYVKMKDGNITFSINAPETGFYTVRAYYTQTYGDSKTQNLSVNGAGAGSAVFPQTSSSTAFEQITLLQKISLNKGANTLKIITSWGWVDIDRIEVGEYVPTSFDLSPAPVNPNASANAKKLYGFLVENFQKKVISGVMTNEVLNGNTPLTDISEQKEVAFIKNSSGEIPALVGFDFMHGVGKRSGEQWFQSYTQGTLNLAEDLWNKGGIPTFSWHWRDPSRVTESFYAKAGDHQDDGTDFDLAAALDAPGGADYNAIIRDIDLVAGYLKTLADKDVPVLWRPLHEAAGGWFWWGAKGSQANKELWILMYDRLVNHHQLDNLIWVWTCEEKDALDWYPGDQYADIVGRDFYYYPPEKNHGSLSASFENLKSVYGGKKLITLSENGSVPYPENLVADGAGWSWFMPWYGAHTGTDGQTAHNTASDWNKIMKHDYVITLGKTPGWGNYDPDPNPTTTEPPATDTPPPNTTANPEPAFRLGFIVTAEGSPSVFDALEILKCLVGMDSAATANPAALITAESQKSGKPSVFDALEILKLLVGMPNLIETPVKSG